MTTTESKLDVVHAVQADFDSIFTWDYERSRPALIKLYEKAKTSQWNASTDLDWSIDVDPEKVSQELGGGGTMRFQALAEAEGSPVKNFGEKEWRRVGVELQNSLLSQFMHGEQGALLCTARIVETVPWIDAKYYAATQVMDEARHVEVFARYLDEKLGYQYRINDNLKQILDDILRDPRWDIAYLGMQIMVEGLALAAFGMMHMVTTEPLLKKLLRYVMSDEARHVAFGVLSLQEYYKELTDKELRERQEFAFDVAQRLQRRFAHAEMWERMGVDSKAVYAVMDRVNPPAQQQFQHLLFSKIVPNCKKLGLLDAADGWLRERFTEIGVIQFEDFVDTGEEYATLDEVAKDRAAAN
ncbi:MAG TPA: ferritin-like domain-containing protein [Acidimicrobiia bacterium]|nr:ferritin-like domain-containing protein [Acidimicrobiia bacterium]